MIWLALLVLMDETVQVPAASTREFTIAVRQKPAIIECEFKVEHGGSGVRVALMQSQHVLIGTGYTRAHRFRFPVPAGDYTVMVDNRLEGRGLADVHLRLSLADPAAQPEPQYLSPERKAVVIAASILFFVVVSYFAGRKLREALRERDAPPA